MNSEWSKIARWVGAPNIALSGFGLERDQLHQYSFAVGVVLSPLLYAVSTQYCFLNDGQSMVSFCTHMVSSLSFLFFFKQWLFYARQGMDCAVVVRLCFIGVRFFFFFLTQRLFPFVRWYYIGFDLYYQHKKELRTSENVTIAAP